MNGSKTIKCPNCGTEARTGANFCPVCGGPLPHTDDVEEEIVEEKIVEESPASTGSEGQSTTAREMLLKSRPPQGYRPNGQSSDVPNNTAMHKSSMPVSSPEGESASAVCLVCGIISGLLPFEFSGVLGNVIGLVLGFVAVYQSSKSKEYGVHNGVQMSGLAMGIIGIILCAIRLFAFMAVAGYVSNSLGSLGSLLNSSGYYYG